MSDGSYRFGQTFDLAVAYLEGASTYYVADHVKAKKKQLLYILIMKAQVIHQLWIGTVIKRWMQYLPYPMKYGRIF